MFGWGDGIQFYIKSVAVYQCPLQRQWPASKNPREVGYTDYWMNSRLAGLREQDVKHKIATILAGDGNDGADGTDARYAIDELPITWLNNTKSPAYRHLEGTNYVFADGHVKWLKPEQIKTKLLAKNPEPAFAVR
jgi:prepilin-type processing-associated H-X9-DG protein